MYGGPGGGYKTYEWLPSALQISYNVNFQIGQRHCLLFRCYLLATNGTVKLLVLVLSLRLLDMRRTS